MKHYWLKYTGDFCLRNRWPLFKDNDVYANRAWVKWYWLGNTLFPIKKYQQGKSRLNSTSCHGLFQIKVFYHQQIQLAIHQNYSDLISCIGNMCRVTSIVKWKHSLGMYFIGYLLHFHGSKRSFADKCAQIISFPN